jgi:hypothetical protein
MGYVYLRYDVFLEYIQGSVKSTYIYICNLGIYILDMCIPGICILGMDELGIHIFRMYILRYK